MDKKNFLNYLHANDFTGLFVECGWAAPSAPAAFPVAVGEQAFSVREVAQKGLRVYASEVDAFPPPSVRRSLDAKLRKFSHAYFVIFTLRREPFHHQWLVPVDAVDKRRIVPVEYADDTHAETLYDKVLGISFGMDETPTVLDVVARVNAQFVVNASDVTKKFYAGFRKQHDAFVKGIAGMADANHRNWYASVMLNRLMFCYFIQKKGFFMDKFFNPDFDYLQHKLDLVVSKKGPNKFFGSFYRGFLKGLFEDGLNSPKRSQKFIDAYGQIPYLNGGMFEAHRLERQYPDVDVPDNVFVKLFAFFDEWRWHLDDRIERDGRDINPDVLGYIFEQYINDRAQMGAYYTKEDITEYIGRNCILPFLFEAVKKADPKPFKPDGEVWKSLKASKDNYIFAAVKKGVELPLPDYIEEGVPVGADPRTARSLRARRSRWNEKAADAYALPTEIWRETVARRQRCEDIRAKIASGKITDIHDFITYNLNIRAFAEDLIRNTSDHLFVRHFYEAIRSVTILDPTCGSGAFLFAALNILEPLYEACLDRMEEAAFAKCFKNELNEIKDKYRSNRQYFIYKNIILRNLYGVDIMHEATEIARLRLFLKMVAVVEADPQQENLGLDPLPDVDFNIRCGNTLVGYASHEHLVKSLKEGGMGLFAEEEIAKVSKKAADVADSCTRFRKEQLSGNSAFYYRKTDLNKMIADLGDQLDATLAKMDYGIDVSTAKGKKAFAEWKKNTQPFHWYSEFYNIIEDRGGFDVIIGNPPYVEYGKELKKLYQINPDSYRSVACANLYAYVIERSIELSSRHDNIGFIVPLTIASNKNMKIIRDVICEQGTVYFSHYETRPARLFDGADQRLTIFLISNDGKKNAFSTQVQRWNNAYREFLFKTVPYASAVVADSVWRMSSDIELSVYNKLQKHRQVEYERVHDTVAKSFQLWYRTAGVRYWILFTNVGFGTESLSNKFADFLSADKAKYFMAALNSNLFWWYYALNFDMFNLKDYMIFAFRLNYDKDKELVKLAEILEKDLTKNRQEQVVNRSTLGRGKTYNYRKKLSKPIIDKIDELLAKHYGFTEEELDFIINYDIKYRMGDELNAE